MPIINDYYPEKYEPRKVVSYTILFDNEKLSSNKFKRTGKVRIFDENQKEFGHIEYWVFEVNGIEIPRVVVSNIAGPYQNQGFGTKLYSALIERYGVATSFYMVCGDEKSGSVGMWHKLARIYGNSMLLDVQGDDISKIEGFYDDMNYRVFGTKNNTPANAFTSYTVAVSVEKLEKIKIAIDNEVICV